MPKTSFSQTSTIYHGLFPFLCLCYVQKFDHCLTPLRDTVVVVYWYDMKYFTHKNADKQLKRGRKTCILTPISCSAWNMVLWSWIVGLCNGLDRCFFVGVVVQANWKCPFFLSFHQYASHHDYSIHLSFVDTRKSRQKKKKEWEVGVFTEGPLVAVLTSMNIVTAIRNVGLGTI